MNVSETVGKQDLQLFGFWASPFSHRVLCALKIKELDYDYIEEDLANKSPLLLKYNPIHKKVPVLVQNGKPILESHIILQYIDETWKHNPLLPTDPHDKAMALFWAHFGDGKLLTSVWSAFLKQGKEREEALSEAWENLNYVEELLKGKKYFNGENIGFLDLCLGWICNFVPVIDEINQFKIIHQEQFPLLAAWMENFSTSPLIKDTWPSNDRLSTRLRYVRDIQLSSATS